MSNLIANETDVDILQEECAEVIQALSKCKRFGKDQVHPETKISNRNALTTELGQLLFMIDEVVKQEELSLVDISNAYAHKRATKKHWDQFNIKNQAGA